ncbi:MAG: putative dual-specificity methyltransferase RlmN [Planctomycetota bacterium]
MKPKSSPSDPVAEASEAVTEAPEVITGAASEADEQAEAGPVVGRRHLLDLTIEAVKGWLAGRGEKPFRAGQIWRWIFQNRAASFEAMSDLPTPLRKALAHDFDLFRGTIAKHQMSADGTEKLLVALADGGEVECVLLRDGPRRSICVSSQVGCAMGCVFCASGLDGVQRNLTRGEILEQMLLLQHRLEPEERLSHIVMMGMGEPLANLDRVLGALDVARDHNGLGISPRRITISTVGLPPAIDKLSRHGIPYNLAVSLHAATDELRDRLVPVNRKVGVEALMAAADRYFETSGRRLTFEYVLLGEVNDSVDDAQQLVRLLRGRGAMLNVIPYNAVAGLPYKTPGGAAIDRFRKTLQQGGINVNFRVRKGAEIDAACGQLRRNRNLVTIGAPGDEAS